MKIGSRYKIARRLGPNVFDKTQGKKFALRSDARAPVRRRRTGSDFGQRLIEKQKARVTYGLNERQFKNAVQSVFAKKTNNMADALIGILESRLDNAVYRLGFAPTRQAARQMVSHGHIDVNGRRIDVPSAQVSIGDVITIRERSKGSALFKDLDERLKETKVPSWLSLDAGKREAKVEGVPKIPQNELSFDMSQVFQYYSSR